MTASLIQLIQQKQEAVTAIQAKLLAEQDFGRKLEIDQELTLALHDLTAARTKYAEWQLSEVKRLEQERAQF